MDMLEQVIKEIEDLKSCHESRAAELCENTNLPCKYNLCDIEDEKAAVLGTVLQKIENIKKAEITAELG